jgi:hypothetical protein
MGSGRRMLVSLAAVVAAMLVFGGVAHAEQAVVVGGGWEFFSFGETGTFDNEGPFTFNSTRPVVVTVTDEACYGDEFRLYDNGSVVGDTSPVPDPGSDCLGDAIDPDQALTDSGYSSGTFRLATGAHSLRIQVTDSPFTGGGAYLRVDAAPAQTPTSKVDCKKGGWRNLANDQGQLFRNQGQCVSYVVAHRS